MCSWDFLAVQWLKLSASTARGTGSISGQGTKVPHPVWPKKKKKYVCVCVFIIVNVKNIFKKISA